LVTLLGNDFCLVDGQPPVDPVTQRRSFSAVVRAADDATSLSPPRADAGEKACTRTTSPPRMSAAATA
jgi:hypothetical protein